uniref:Polypeptide N-acetylgalactosaminyltransferase 15-like n=1 Tax=Hippocampus comes TaxID=109280 RepID=A0A3Q2XK60_HIPCM
MGLWGLHRRILCLWLLLLGFTLLLLIVADLFHGGERHSQQKLVGAPRRPFQQSLRPPDDLELLGDAALELVPDFVPINSLKEDQLLFVASTQGTKDPPHKKGNYKVLLPAARKEFLSARVGQGAPPDRSLPETRHPKCLGEQYSESLPSASVVICFHDEAWSTLLRTLHSVLNTTPRSFLLELLLVDDLSTHGMHDLKTMLSEYVSQLDGVHLIRSTKRLGAGGCRNLGASKASGEVLVFMDSHCECHSGWLEPLLERVAQDRTRVVSPILDVIHRDTFKYNATRWPVWGVFDWNLDFSWESKPQLLDGDSDLAIEPVLSPALGGGVLAVDRHFFHNVGAFDPGILLWGGEQIELSIRVWLCGGSMEVVPCSRVAHLDYHQLRRLQDQEQLERNKIRIADTWMDTYRNIFYRRDTLAHFIRQSERPNITERQQLKMTLGCRDFHWYLTTIHPQLYIPQDRPGLSGEVITGGSFPVSAANQRKASVDLHKGKVGIVLTWFRMAEDIKWYFSNLSRSLSNLHGFDLLQLSGHIPSDEVGAHTGEGDLVLRPCTRHPTQQWYFEQLVSP